MRLLLDTHTLIWWLTDPERLPSKVAAALADPANQVFVSAVSAMEITTKTRLGKLPQMSAIAPVLEETVLDQGFSTLDLPFADASAAGLMDFPNRDPFDRLIVAQAIRGQMVLVSNEAGFDATGVTRLWS